MDSYLSNKDEVKRLAGIAKEQPELFKNVIERLEQEGHPDASTLRSIFKEGREQCRSAMTG